ncbi:hypothetical protein HOY80DRAFT_1041982 [Tuber brumale]|nr:hypothetical protein HOY80DRAFT_1041982 [Tuber brumale]
MTLDMSEKENELEAGQTSSGSSDGGDGGDSGDSRDSEDSRDSGSSVDGDSDDSLALVLAGSAAPTEDPHASLNPTAAVFVFESKLCPVTYSFHPYTKMSNSGNGAIHGLGRPALTLKSTALNQLKANTGTPRVYQSESRNMFVAEYERFKEIKMNLQNSFPASIITSANFDEWVDFRAEITEDRIRELKNKIENRTKEAEAKKKAFSRGPVRNYEIDPSRFAKPIIPFPRSIVGGQPPPVIKKANDVYFENWSRIGHLWGKDTEPMPRTYPYNYGQETIWGPPTMPPTGTIPRSPKLAPVGCAMHGAPTSRPKPAPHAPGGTASTSGTGGTATSSSKAPEYPGFQGGMPVPATTAFPGAPQSNGGYANDHYFRSQPGGGYQQNPNPSTWSNYNSVPPPNFAGGPYVGNQFGGGYYGRGPVPQAGSQNPGAYNNGYYGHNFNPPQPGFTPGAQNANFVPSGGPSVNFQKPGFAPSAQNAKFAPNGGHNNGFQQPGFAPGAQNVKFAQNGGHNFNVPQPGFAPGAQNADPNQNGGHNSSFQKPGFAPGAQNTNFTQNGGHNNSFQKPGFAPGAQNTNFAQNGGHNNSFQKPGFAPAAQNINFTQNGGHNNSFQKPGFAPAVQNTNFTQNGGQNHGFQQPGFAPGAQKGNFGQKGGPFSGFVPGRASAPAPAPTSAGHANGSAGPFQNVPQKRPITGYAFESDDDYVPEDYVNEGYDVGEEGGQERFDGYDAPSSFHRDLSDFIPGLSLADTNEGGERAEPITGAQSRGGGRY